MKIHCIAFVLAVFVMVLIATPVKAIDINVGTVGEMSSNNQAAWWSPIVERNGTAYMSYLVPTSPER